MVFDCLSSLLSFFSLLFLSNECFSLIFVFVAAIHFFVCGGGGLCCFCSTCVSARIQLVVFCAVCPSAIAMKVNQCFISPGRKDWFCSIVSQHQFFYFFLNMFGWYFGHSDCLFRF